MLDDEEKQVATEARKLADDAEGARSMLQQEASSTSSALLVERQARKLAEERLEQERKNRDRMEQALRTAQQEAFRLAQSSCWLPDE